MNYKYQITRDWNATYNNIQTTHEVVSNFITLNRKLYEFITTTQQTIEIVPDWTLPTVQWVIDKLEGLYQDLQTNILPEYSKKVLQRPTVNVVDADTPVTTVLVASSPDETYYDLEFLWQIDDRIYQGKYITVPFPITTPFKVKCKTRSPVLGLESLWQEYTNNPTIIPETVPKVTVLHPNEFRSDGLYNLIIDINDTVEYIMIYSDNLSFNLYGNTYDSNHYIATNVSQPLEITVYYNGSYVDHFVTVNVVMYKNKKLYKQTINIPCTANQTPPKIHMSSVYIVNSNNNINQQTCFVYFTAPVVDDINYKYRIVNILNNKTYYKNEHGKYWIPIHEINDSIHFQILDQNNNIVDSRPIDIKTVYANFFVVDDTLQDLVDSISFNIQGSVLTTIITPIESYPSRNIQNILTQYETNLITCYYDLTNLDSTHMTNIDSNIVKYITTLYGEFFLDVPIKIYPKDLLTINVDKVITGPIYYKFLNDRSETFSFIQNFTMYYINYNKRIVNSFQIVNDEMIRLCCVCNDNYIIFTDENIYMLYNDILYKYASLYYNDVLYDFKNNIFLLHEYDNNIYITALKHIFTITHSSYSTQLQDTISKYRFSYKPFGIVELNSNSSVYLYEIDVRNVFENSIYLIDSINQQYYKLTVKDGKIVLLPVSNVTSYMQYIKLKDGTKYYELRVNNGSITLTLTLDSDNAYSYYKVTDENTKIVYRLKVVDGNIVLEELGSAQDNTLFSPTVSDDLIITNKYEYNIVNAIDVVGKYVITSDGSFLDLETSELYSSYIPLQNISNKTFLTENIISFMSNNIIYVVDFQNRLLHQINYIENFVQNIQVVKDLLNVVLIVQDDSRIYTINLEPGIFFLSGNQIISIVSISMSQPTTVQRSLVQTLNQQLQQKQIFTPTKIPYTSNNF